MTTKPEDKKNMSEIDEGISKIFDIKKRLGKGAYGIVWKALEKRTNETFAVKKIFDAFRDETDAQRTFREIIFLKAFRNHPNIIKLHNIYTASNNLDIYLIFEYMESDLHNIIKRGTILKDIHKRYVMYQLINAIKYIHSGNVIHRDLKPSNILIDSKCRCKLADFGLARSVANHCVSGDNNDMSNEKPTELLLTDYVATRWYRAPEILVASKRYTKGIDMWSLGCILGEMIRGKPIFQGSSTINQIEKIVYTLPDITDHDIRSVGAGFGSVLLNKQVLKDKKTTLNDLLSDASGDAMDLVKSLLVLDPMARLTAPQALNHPYVEKFRNSVPELELNVDILPPVRDDIRLTVSEYRTKLYEIVQMRKEKQRSLDNNTNYTNTLKTRDHKPHQKLPEKSEQKKNAKFKPCSTNFAENNSIPNHASGNTIIHKGVKKSIPFTKSDSKTFFNSTGSDISSEERSNIKDETQPQISRTPSCYNFKLCKETIEDELSGKEIKTIKCSPNQLDSSVLFENGSTKRNTTRKLHRSAKMLNSTENYGSNKVEHVAQYSTPIGGKNVLRHTKSEVIPLNNTPSSNSSKVHERICYEKRLRELEKEIERYKKEVKSFCRETYRPSQQKQRNEWSNEKTTNNVNFDFKRPSKKITANTSSPIKNIYFQLLTKGQHKDYHKSDLDLSDNSGIGSSSADNFRNSLYTNSYSGRSNPLKSSHYNRIGNWYRATKN